MKLTIQTHVHAERVIVKVRGVLDFSAKERFFLLMNQFENGNHSLIIDLEDVSFIDSAGVGMLALFAKRFEVVGQIKEVKIVNPRGQVRDSLQQSNISALIPVLDSDESYLTFTNLPH